MQHLQYGINSLSEFAIARRLPLLRGTCRHIISPCLLIDRRLAIFPTSDWPRLRFGPQADRARVINAFIVLSLIICVMLSDAKLQYLTYCIQGGLVAEWSACWTQAQKGLGLNRSRDAVV